MTTISVLSLVGVFLSILINVGIALSRSLWKPRGKVAEEFAKLAAESSEKLFHVKVAELEQRIETARSQFGHMHDQLCHARQREMRADMVLEFSKLTEPILSQLALAQGLLNELNRIAGERTTSSALIATLDRRVERLEEAVRR